MPTPLTPAEVAEEFGDILAQYHAETMSLADFKTAYTALWNDATTGGTSIPLIGAQISAVLGLWNSNQVQMNTWMTGSATFDSSDPDQPDLGWYPLTNYLGLTIWLPCPARMVADFNGIEVAGTVGTVGELPGSAPNGTIYIVGGHYYIRQGSSWVDAGAFVGPQGIQGVPGNKGWSPVLAFVVNGAGYAAQVTDWVGGEGTKPATGSYIGATGLVASIGDAINVRGPQGAQGIQGDEGPQGPQGLSYVPDAVGPIAGRSAYDAEAEGFGYLATDEGLLYFRVGVSGWSAGIEFGKGDQGDQGFKGWSPAFAIVNDGTRRVLQVDDWVGGQGVKPAVGDYVGATGLVAAIGDAVDIRGPQGVQGPQGDPGPQGDEGPQGMAFTINAVGPFSERSAYNSEADGFVFLASDQARLYVRVDGNWSEGVPLVSGQYLRFDISTVATGSTQNIALPFAVALSDILFFESGIEQNKTGLSIVGSTLTVEAREAGNPLRVMLPGGNTGPQGEVGPQGDPGPQGDTGPALNLIGALANSSELPGSGTAGDGYMINGELWIWDTLTDDWVNVGPPGPAGPAGADGADATLSDDTPVGLGATASPGVDPEASRSDHRHQFPLGQGREITTPGPLQASDHGTIVAWNSVSGALELPNNLFAGFNCMVYVAHATGLPTFTPLSGAVIRQADSFNKARKQYSLVTLVVLSNSGGAAAEYLLGGDMSS